ncbi:DRC7 [Symbiodinium sp. CCMP2592]|nr:DRC7 [Symbiodinium sp. CCMP2592]
MPSRLGNIPTLLPWLAASRLASAALEGDVQWNELASTTLSLAAHQIVYDNRSDSLWLYGGQFGLGDDDSTDELWKFDCQTQSWSNQTVSSSAKPPAMHNHRMVYDDQHHSLWLLSYGSGESGDDLWTLQLDTLVWSKPELTTSRPPGFALQGSQARYAPAVVYDGGSRALWLHGGGWDADGNVFWDLWRLDLQSLEWNETMVNAATRPSGRRNAQLVYDSSRNALWLHGGVNPPNQLSDLWQLQIASMTWRELTFGEKPSGRHAHQLAYDSSSDALWLHGGFAGKPLNDLWKLELDTMQWRQLSFDVMPSGRWQHGMVFATASASLYLHGGFKSQSDYSRYLWKLQDVRNATDIPGQSYGLSGSAGNDNGDLPEPRPSLAEVPTEGGQSEVAAAPRTFAEDSKGLLERWKNSPWFLAILMLFESVNLVSSTIYVVEAYQRAVLTDLYVTCSDGTVLVPIFAAQCPAENAVLNGMRNCDAALAIGDVCEADAVTDGSKNCDTSNTLQNCGIYDVYRRTSTCGACGTLAHLLWVSAAASLFCTVGWTCRFYTKRLELCFVSVRPRLRRQHHFLYALLGSWLLLATGIGLFMEGGIVVLLMAVVCPMAAWLLWLFALVIIVHDPTAEEEVFHQVQQSAALELPLFNVLVAFLMEEKDIRQLNQFRLPLQQGLRIFEDLPECMIGAVDLLFFGGSWFTALGIGMSLLMITLQLSMAVSANVLQQARLIARPRHRRQIDRE